MRSLQYGEREIERVLFLFLFSLLGMYPSRGKGLLAFWEKGKRRLDPSTLYQVGSFANIRTGRRSPWLGRHYVSIINW